MEVKELGHLVLYVRNLQRSVNDMEELVEITTQPLGVADHADATPIHIQGGRIRAFEQVTLRAATHPELKVVMLLRQPPRRPRR